MNPMDPKWSRLVAAARGATDDRDTSAPYGFATRVSALALAGRGSNPPLLERWSLRALGVAGLLAAVSVASNFSAIISTMRNDATGLDDPVGDVVEIVS
ncbi:MAG: hypothetical protein JWM32_521 [Verrucomicrobia bacterium]|nr:hypothetical protein [Verrucomicrobiota bacterium]